ncbi:MAG: tRNA (5-methylaminomethyl-2-thiouridine)(34)-methyltransferase MnmD [Saprospiraceae bacterium]|nr:tRNA (5-methylaminomethyl-2-thiouridine)(34)-methyltransferase MnmD [Saprospiraceae bacterium]
MKFDVQLTEDGSHTIHSQEYGSTFHSRFGAIQESNVVFIQSGLRYFLDQESVLPDEPIRILEMGLGTGLNAWLSLIESNDRHRKIDYTALEKHPLPMHIVEDLNYPVAYRSELAELFLSIHRSPSAKRVDLSPDFQLLKVCTDATQWHGGQEQYHIIYFDAFSPSIQPELWSAETLEPFVEGLQTGGVFVTYCAKGEVRRTLQRLGLSIDRLPGPPGKREMLRGTKP